MLRRFRVMIVLAIVAFGALATGVARAADTVTDGTVTSKDGTAIAYSIFKPAAASSTNQVPLILHSHGWGGSRTKTITAGFKTWLDQGFGLLSFDQRGHGASGGQANVEDPEIEGYDVEAIIDRVAAQDWVKMDAPGDPVLGAIGGSYGGGYQTMGALGEILHHGATRFNALAPEITWYDLPDSLGPSGVPRTLWTSLLYAAAPPHASYIDQNEAVGLATGDFPDGTIPGFDLKGEFARHSPRWFPDHGMHLNIPVLFGQGITDNLFNLNQGIHNFERVLSDDARAKSILVGYNSGHVLPEALPLSNNPSGNPCVSNWSQFERDFFTKAFAGLNPRVALGQKSFNIATDGSGCVRSDSLGTATSAPVGPLGTVAITAPAGAPLNLPLGVNGPITLSGIPHLKGTLTTVGADVRAFFALSVGTTSADAHVIQNNVLPIRRLLPTVGEAIDQELPGIAIQVPAGQQLFLTVSPISTQFVGNRYPGVITITDATVDLPVVS